MRFFHDIQKNIRCWVAGNKGSIEELEMSPFRQAPGTTSIFFIADERRYLGYFLQNFVEFCCRGRAEDVDVDGQPAGNRYMQQETRTALNTNFRSLSARCPRRAKAWSARSRSEGSTPLSSFLFLSSQSAVKQISAIIYMIH